MWFLTEKNLTLDDDLDVAGEYLTWDLFWILLVWEET